MDDTLVDESDGIGEDEAAGRPRRRLRRRGAHGVSRHTRRKRWRYVLVGGGAVMVAYYALVFGSLQLNDTSAVDLDDSAVRNPGDRVTLQIEAVGLDTSTGSFDLRLRPVPRGSFAEPETGQLVQPLQVVVTSPGQPATTYDFPAQQLIDPVAVSVEASTGAQRFPFDHPEMAFRAEGLSLDERVPVDLDMADQTEGWNLRGVVDDQNDLLVVDLTGSREMLPVSFTLFYIGGIVVVALITVAVIGGAIARGQVGFDQVIWLGAMLVAVPAVRNEMPGVPPIGTLVDLFVFLPSIVIVGLALLAAIVVLVINEAAANRPVEGGD